MYELRVGVFCFFFCYCFFFFKQKTAYEIGVRLVGSEMCIRDSCSSIIKNGVGIFPDPILRFLYCYQLLALLAFTILAAGSLPMAELLRVLASWAP